MHAYDFSPCGGTAAAVLDDDADDIRIEKILDIRRQLGEGRYNIAQRLDAVVDRLLDALRA